MALFGTLGAGASVANTSISGLISGTQIGTPFPINTNRFGIGQASSNNRDLQLITWTGTKNNGTITLLTEGTMSENPYSGIIGLNMMAGGLGTSRLYFLTGRFAASTLTMYQGGNRSAGEDASISLTGGSNTFGLNFTSSGYGSGTGYIVWALIGIQVTNYSGNDKWLTN